MSRLREKLVEHYADHYTRLNSDINPTATPGHVLRALDATFGPALTRVRPGGRVLDVGCGTGIMLHWLTRRGGVVPVGVDASESQMHVLKRHLPGVEAYCADGLSFMRERAGSFDAIICTDVLEHIPEPALLDWVEAARDALVPGGVFLCRVPNGANLTSPHARYIDMTHERCFTSKSLLQLLEVGGFSDCRIVPIRSAHFTGRARLLVERVLHRVVFAICGDTREKVFTGNVMASAVRGSA